MPSDLRLPQTLSAAPARVRRTVLRHRRLLAFVLTCASALGALHAVRPPPPPDVALLVAAHDLPAGETLTASDLVTVRVPPADVPDGAETHAAGQILAGAVRRGEPITDLRVVGPALSTGDPTRAAVPVRFGDAGMAALLRVGDRLRLLTTDPSTGATSVVADGVEVLAVPDEDVGQTSVTNTQSGRLVVVGVSDDLVTAVTSAAVGGFLTFAYEH